MEQFSLKGKKGLIVGIANNSSIAYGCAKVLNSLGAECAITYANDKSKSYVEPIAKELGAKIFMEMDIRNDSQINDIFNTIKMD